MGFAGIVASPLPGHAAVGTLPEYGDTNAIIQGITVNVADKSQQDAMVDFLTKSFDFQVLRKRILDGVEDTVCVLENCERRWNPYHSLPICADFSASAVMESAT